MRFLIGLAAFALAACGEDPAPPPAVEPTSFTISPDDLWKPSPDDICRARNPAFLSDLTDRIRAALPPEDLPGFEFAGFNVTSDRGSGREAVLRFRAGDGSEAPATMVAVGQIDAATCAIGPMQMGAGVSAMDLLEAETVTVP
ncbi:hypothetical protein [Erythrobacter sp. EC-HK427]|uniref:hypothetical protein n=1 Tax=Erythrobacter sp. EC-HK427 TaxID=2038396 RepID=UPI001254AC29|nr:hypothetical protein [Erythrobacter sp. EC-HK427]VVT07245.1 conserved hypothetical protein [Erythrobacter sp. EC-HK427]